MSLLELWVMARRWILSDGADVEALEVLCQYMPAECPGPAVYCYWLRARMRRVSVELVLIYS